MTSSPPILVVAFALLLLFILLLALFYLIHRLRLRRRQLHLELGDAPGLVNDRAFNQMRLARSEAEILDARGIDVQKPRALLARAQQRYDLRDFSEALSLARSAHESLVTLRAHGPSRLPSSAGAARPDLLNAPEPPASSDGPVPVGGTTGAAPAPAPRLAKNRAESHFQMLLLAEEVQRARSSGSPAENLAGTLELQRQSEEAYGAGEYTDALRIALKARRTLGAPLETLPAPKGVRTPPDAPTGSGGNGGSGGVPCPKCGKAIAPQDRFCRSCGSPKIDRRCPRCGMATRSDDTFCGTCGSPLGSGPG